MAHVPVLGLILALALGLVSLTLIARLPQREAVPGITWLPITLLLYNLWVAAFLTANYLRESMLPRGAPRLPPLVDGWTLALLALALTWVYAHIAQLQAFLGAEPSRGARRGATLVFGALGAILVAGWFASAWAGDGTIFRYMVSFTAVSVFPAALVSSAVFFRRARRVADLPWRGRLSRLGLAYVVLFACLFVLSLSWRRLAAISPVLPLALDALLELLYNVVAIVWVMRVHSWQARTPSVRAVASALDRGRLFAEYGVTRREAEIIELICEGKTNQEIADQLFISLTTVKDHNYVTFQKLGVRNRTELTRLVLGASQAAPK